MYERADSSDEAFGFSPDDWAPVELWPENVTAFDIFRRMATQWRVGMSGPVGLDYAVLYRLLDDAADGDRKEWYWMLDDIAVMESAALEGMRQKDG